MTYEESSDPRTVGEHCFVSESITTVFNCTALDGWSVGIETSTETGRVVSWEKVSNVLSDAL